jgi:hypothetical protein
MIRKLVSCVFLATLLLIGAAPRDEPHRLQSDSGKQSEPATKSVAGKVASIGNSGTTFALHVDGDDKQVMNFVVGKSKCAGRDCEHHVFSGGRVAPN